jgi:hypothetical protein
MKTIVRSSERGSAGVKFLLIFVALIIVGNAGYNYIPVAYAGENFKSDVETAVVNGLAMPGRFDPAEVIKRRVQDSIYNNSLPSDTFVEVKQVQNVYQVHAVYTQPVHVLPFGIYTYNYHFDKTIVPSGYLLKDH